jgi:hypothetical protein
MKKNQIWPIDIIVFAINCTAAVKNHYLVTKPTATPMCKQKTAPITMQFAHLVIFCPYTMTNITLQKHYIRSCTRILISSMVVNHQY